MRSKVLWLGLSIGFLYTAGVLALLTGHPVVTVIAIALLMFGCTTCAGRICVRETRLNTIAALHDVKDALQHAGWDKDQETMQRP